MPILLFFYFIVAMTFMVIFGTKAGKVAAGFITLLILTGVGELDSCHFWVALLLLAGLSIGAFLHHDMLRDYFSSHSTTNTAKMTVIAVLHFLCLLSCIVVTLGGIWILLPTAVTFFCGLVDWVVSMIIATRWETRSFIEEGP